MVWFQTPACHWLGTGSHVLQQSRLSSAEPWQQSPDCPGPHIQRTAAMKPRASLPASHPLFLLLAVCLALGADGEC